MAYELKDLLSLIVSPRVKDRPLTEVYYKDEELQKAFKRSAFIVNRFCSYNFKTQKVALRLNRYLFSGHHDILFGYLGKFTEDLNGNFGSVPYFKASKKERKYPDEVVDALRRYLGYEHLSREEIEEVIDINLKNNKEGFLKFLLSCGFEVKWIKKNFEELKDICPTSKKPSKKELRELQKKVSLVKKKEEHSLISEVDDLL